MTIEATVLGAGIAGLIAAQQLSTRFDKVTLIDRDSFNASAVGRNGTPHAPHAHILLKRGLTELEAIFPGFRADLIAAGGVEISTTEDLCGLFPMGYLKKFAADVTFVSASRTLMEVTLRKFVLANPKITLVQNARVLRLNFSRQSFPTAIVEIDGTEHQYRPQLLVDALGRSSQTEVALAAGGFPHQWKDAVSPFLGYASRRYRSVSMPPGFKAAIILAKDPHLPKGGVILPCEGNSAICTLYGFSKNYPPGDEAGFLEFARSLRSHEIYDAIRNAEPMGPIKQYRKDENHFVNFAAHGEWPASFLVVGDAVCSFNPVYGQGMSAIAMSTQAMTKTLSAVKIPIETPFDTRKIQQDIVRSYKLPWTISVTEDLRWPMTQGKTATLLAKVNHAITNRIVHGATKDEYLCYHYVNVMHMNESPLVFMSPKFVWRLLTLGKPRS